MSITRMSPASNRRLNYFRAMRCGGSRLISPSYLSFAEALVSATSFKRRTQLARPSWLRLTRRRRGGISRQFRYLRDLPPASSEYSPQLTQRSRHRLAAYDMNHELLRDYWTSLLLHARRPH